MPVLGASRMPVRGQDRHNYVLVFLINEIDFSRRDFAMAEIKDHRSACQMFSSLIVILLEFEGVIDVDLC